ncbi:MAG: glycosyl transferase, WecB/TagA/CpsF family [Bacteroidetes bacterium]|nr:glycosyl transferase, WecB/TagA/CpsF family [Bacteroidota bacterium]
MTLPTESPINNQPKEADSSHHPKQLPKINILGVYVHVVSMTEVLSAVADMATRNAPHQVATVNPEFIMTAQRHHEFRKVLNDSSLAFADGIGVVWASRILGHPIAERVPGVEVVENLATIAAERGLRVFLLGGAPGIAEEAAQRLKERNPRLIIAGTYAGSPKPGDDAMICGIVEKAKPHFLFVAYGAPNQDLWIARNQPRLKIPVAMGVGGTFDFIVGKSVRAPRVFRMVGLEWLYRLIREPGRWKRQLALPRFAIAVFLQRLRVRSATG